MVIFPLESLIKFLFFKSCNTLLITVLEVPSFIAICSFVILISFELKEFRNSKILLSNLLNFTSSIKVVNDVYRKVKREKIIF